MITLVMVVVARMTEKPYKQKVFSLNFGKCENHEDTYREFASMLKNIKARNVFNGDIKYIGNTTLIGSRTLAVELCPDDIPSSILEYTILQYELKYKDIPVKLCKTVDDLGICIEISRISDWIVYIGDTPRILLDDMDDNLAKMFIDQGYSLTSIHGIMSNMIPCRSDGSNNLWY